MGLNANPDNLSDQQIDESTADGDRSGGQEDAFDAGEYVRQLIARMESSDDQPPASSETEEVEEVAEKPPSEPAEPVATEKPARRFRDPRTADPDVKTEPIAPRFANDVKTDTTRRPTRAEELGVNVDAGIRSTNEINVDLEKLREVVNMSTSDALYTFDCSSLIRRSYSHLFNAVFAIAVSWILASMSSEPFSAAHLAAIGLLVYGAIMTLRFCMSTRVLWRKTRQVIAERQSVKSTATSPLH